MPSPTDRIWARHERPLRHAPGRPELVYRLWARGAEPERRQPSGRAVERTVLRQTGQRAPVTTVLEAPPAIRSKPRKEPRLAAPERAPVDLDALHREVLGRVLRDVEAQTMRGEDPDGLGLWL